MAEFFDLDSESTLAESDCAEQSSPPPRLTGTRSSGSITSAFLATGTVACGASDNSDNPPTGGSEANPNLPQRNISHIQASRFLAQATNGSNFDTIDAVARNGIESWLSAQFAMDRSRSYWDWLERNGHADESQTFALGAWEIALWHGLLHDGDILRQRMTLALLDIFVVGIGTLPPYWRSFSMANYLDIIADHSFGNFRELLEAITYSTAMGDWLTYIGSKKANGAGRLPDENYARELMQLFTIGLHWLNDDGSARLGSDGQPIPTFSQADILELSRVFTGLIPSHPDNLKRARYRERLIVDPASNDSGTKHVLGQTISGGGREAISHALDILFAHPNVGPFIGRQLIQKMVTSNPSRAYVQRVASAFANNGSGQRGDLKAVLRAILLDPEARGSSPSFAGKLRDPVQRLLNWARAFDVRPEASILQSPYLHPGLLKAPGWSPTVFNFFEVNYSPPLTIIQQQNLYAPEFQIVSEQTVIEYLTYMEHAIYGHWGSRGLAPQFDHFIDLATNPSALVERLNLVLAAGQLSSNTVIRVASEVSAMPATDREALEKRIRFATLMVLASPEYLVLV